MSPRTSYWAGRVRAAFTDALGDEATVDEGFGPIAVDVPAARWTEAVELARDALDCTFFDFLTAVDELTDGFRIVCHLADHHPRGVEHLVLRTLVPREQPRLPSVVHLYAGAKWHERETHEMFGVEFTGPDGDVLELEKLLLPENFEGHPLRKDFVLASRVAKPWPGAKEPGESDHQAAAPSRRRTRPPGVPEPEQWGPRPAGSEAPDPLAVAAPSGPARRPRREAGGAAAGRGASASRASAAGDVPAGGAASTASPGEGGAPNQPRSARRPDPSTVAPPPPSDSADSADSARAAAPPPSSPAPDSGSEDSARSEAAPPSPAPDPADSARSAPSSPPATSEPSSEEDDSASGGGDA